MSECMNRRKSVVTVGCVRRRIDGIKRRWTPEERRLRRENAVHCVAQLAAILGIRKKAKN